MLLVIFGAGASHDSYGGPRGVMTPSKPPLAAGLVDRQYDVLADNIPEARPVIQRLRQRMSSGGDAPSLEDELSILAERAEDFPRLRRQLVAFRLHMWQVIHRSVDCDWLAFTHGDTNYARLLMTLIDWQHDTGHRVLLATFNYDLLLDSALRDQMGAWTRDDFDSYVNRDDFRLFKLHGSTDWSRRVPLPGVPVDTEMELILHNADQIDDHVGELTLAPPSASPQEPYGAITSFLSLPAIALPVASKVDFACPSDHVAKLRADLPRVDRVLIVGWRAAEAHAVDLLRALSPGFRLGVVTKDRDARAELDDNLADVFNRARVMEPAVDGFSNFAPENDRGLAELLAPDALNR